MGMYDRVVVVCPACRKGDIEFQSKADECNLINYDLTNVPANIALDLDGESNKCKNCGHTVTFKCRTMAQCWIE